ncbi:MAG: tRNA (adenosine(37)-N6)-threonylcarbamoyltransferase complex dimerization subunit type 1 TsaB [Magnetospirillum sp. WYHS-4]
MTTVLAFDTATTACSAALWRDGRILSRRFESMPRGQSEALVPMILAVLAEAGIDWPDIDLLAVTVGPGAFTGLRIGLATARGMALAANRPCLGIGTLEAVAAAAGLGASPLLVALETKRADLYVQVFAADGSPLSEPMAVPPENLPAHLPPGPLRVAGDAAERVRSLYPEAVFLAVPGEPDAAIVAALAAARWRPGATAPPPAPLYLRPPDVSMPPAP